LALLERGTRQREREIEKRSERERRKCRRQEAENGTGWNVYRCGWVHVCVHVWIKARIGTSRKERSAAAATKGF
jgi:hypothetical protein